jgi:WD40 repeat protein/serine/threonine protein kinase
MSKEHDLDLEHTSTRKRRVEELFSAALDVTAEARAGFLDRACAGDAELRQEVEELLDAAHAQTQGPLEPRKLAGPSALENLHPSLQGLALAPGSRIVGRYELLRSLGQGGMGTVFLADDRRLHRRVAIKFLHAATQEMTRRFLDEAQATARCKHENIVIVHDVDELDGHPYMVLEHLEGKPLRQRLAGLVGSDDTASATPAARRSGAATPAMPVAEVLGLMVPVVRAIVCAHKRGIVHRDLKPENVFLCSDGTVKVLDFGIAKVLTDARGLDITTTSSAAFASTMRPLERVVTESGALLGTLPYMSPEQWGAGEIDELTDIWAVGIMLYEMLAGRHPLAPLSYARLARLVPDLDTAMPAIGATVTGLGALASLVDNCLRKHPAERMASAQKLLDALSIERWQHTERHPQQAPVLPRMVEAPSINPAGYAKPSSPDIIDFTGERGRHEHFFGRQDILRELDDLLRGRESGWLLLTGSPGLGKSAIFNQWLGLRERAGLPTAFHFIRRGIHNWAEPSIVRASLAAQLERDFPEQRAPEADPQQRLEQLLHRISPVLELRQQQLVLLVDGLDEAMTLGGVDNPIPRIFPHELPRRVFVFAASRPLYPHLNWFTRRTGALHAIDLDGRPGNLETVRAFWAALRGTLSPPPGDDLVRAAVERSEGNLLHAIKLHQRWRQPGAERSIDSIPQGFVGMLSDFWERLGNLPEDQWEIARQGLSLLCAARQALPLGTIDELLQWREGKARHNLLPLVRELLHEERWHEQPAYRPFHEGVRELVERELPETIREHHRRLASFAAWPSSGNEFRRDYALRHRVVHQVAGGQGEDAAASCRDVSYLTEKACAFGVLEVEREIRLAARIQGPTVRKHLGTLALAVGACSHWAREAPKALPFLLHDRLLSYAPVVRDGLVWPIHLHQNGPLLRHPLQTGGLARVLPGHQNWVTAVAVLPDGRLVSGSSDYTLRVWDVESGQALAALAGHQGLVWAVAVLPDGRLVSGSSDYTLRVWDVESGHVLATLRGHQGSISSVAVLPDGRVISGSDDKTLRVWDVESGHILATLKGHQGGVRTVAVLPDGRVISGSDDKTLRIWDVASGHALATLEGHQHGVRAVAVLSDGRVVSGSDDETLRVWDIASGHALATLKGHQGGVNAVAVWRDGRVVSGSDDKTLRVWDVESGHALATLKGHQGLVWAVSVLPDGRVVSGSLDKTLRIWDVESGHGFVAREGHHDWVAAVSVLPDGRVVSGSDDKTLRVWNVESGHVLATLKGHQGLVWAVAALPDGRVVSGSDDKTLRVWDVESGHALATLADHQGLVGAVAVLPDGRVVSGSDDKTLRIWDVENEHALATLVGHQGAVTAVSVLSDTRLVSGSEDKTLRIWDVESGHALATLVGHQGGVRAVAVLPGKRVVSGSDDKTLCVWDVESGHALATLVGHQDRVRTVAVLPDGRVASGSDDKTLRIWDVESGQARTVVYGDASFTSLAVVTQHLIAAGDALGNVWFIDLVLSDDSIERVSS